MTRLLAILAAACLGWAAPAAAQNPFAPVATVNGTAITAYSVQQRLQFLTLLSAPDADAASVTGTLIDETLQVQAARQAGIEVTPEELQAGLTEFAGRANMTAEAFTEQLGRAGIAPETFTGFVSAGLSWREFVRQEFGDRARPPEPEVARLAQLGGVPGAGVRVLLSEIALPITPENRAEVEALAQRLSDNVRGEAAFAAAARTYSRSNTAPRGGTVDPLDLAGLAPPIAGQVIGLMPGEVSQPVNLGGFIALFLLRGIDESGTGAPATGPVDFAEYLIPGGRSPEGLAAAARLRARVDTCDDLYPIARDQPPGVLTRRTADPSQLAPDLRQELAKLDPGEESVLLERDGVLRFVMLCGRGAAPTPEEIQAIGGQILSQRLESYAETYLAELRADATITR